MVAETNTQNTTESKGATADQSPIEFPAAIAQTTFRIARASEDDSLVNTIDLRDGFYYSV